MFVNKIGNGFQNLAFKGYQYEIDDIGATKIRFNYPHDYNTKEAYVELFRVRRNPKEYCGYEVVDGENPIARVKIDKGGTIIDPSKLLNIDKEDAFAYRINVNGDKFADTGVSMNFGNYTLVTNKGTRPMVQGAGYLTMPDAHYAGIKRHGFNSDKAGEIYFDKEAQKKAEDSVRIFSGKFGGNLAGLEYDIPNLRKAGYKILYATPIAGGDDISYHRYWNKNNMQIAGDMGSVEDYKSFMRTLFKNGMKYVFDGTFTSEGLEGIHLQYALRWAHKKPDEYYWFNMEGLNDAPIGMGIVPKNKDNLRYRIINPTVIYKQDSNGNVKVEKNPNYNPSKETYFQVYDATLASEKQVNKLDAAIRTYENTNGKDKLAINSWQDTAVCYVVQINPKEYEARLNNLNEVNKKSEKPIMLNSPEGALFVGNFSNFRISTDSEGLVQWDANVDMAKMRHAMSPYDEKILKAIPSESQRNYERKMYERATNQTTDMIVQAGRYWTKLGQDANKLYVADVIKGASTEAEINKLIEDGLLPKEARLSAQAIQNILSGNYLLDPIGLLDKDDTTVKALMELPLDALELGENTVGVLSSPFFSNRATSEDMVGLTRFELMQKNNPQLDNVHSSNYLRVNNLFKNEIKDFTDEIIKKLNSQSSEKLLDAKGNYTEFGEYVINFVGQDIAKYALLKAIAGDKLKTKQNEKGEILYDYESLKKDTTLKSLGINAYTPEEEAAQLERHISRGLSKLNNNDVEYIIKSLSKRLEGKNAITFRFSEAMVKQACLGTDWRIDAFKDVVDMDSVRSKDMSFEQAWDSLIPIWSKFTKAVKEQNPSSVIIAELTDVADMMRRSYGDKFNWSEDGGYNNLNQIGAKYRKEDEAILQLMQQTGVTTEAGYSFFFTSLINAFTKDFEEGKNTGNLNGVMDRLRALCTSRDADYIRNLFSFVGNQDKPRIIHYMALDLGLYYASLQGFHDAEGCSPEIMEARKAALMMIAGVNKFEDLPLEFRMNLDNPDYFKTVSSRAVAMSKLLSDSLHETMDGKISNTEMEFLNKALADLTEGRYLGNGDNTTRLTVNVPELQSVERAFAAILELAEKNHGLKLTSVQKEELIRKVSEYAKKDENIANHLIQGDFDWNNEIGKRNQEIAKNVLRGSNASTDEWDLCKYSTFTVSVASLLREAFLQTSDDKGAISKAVLDATADFTRRFNRTTVNAHSNGLPLVESAQNAMRKNGYAANDIEDNVRMLIEQAEYLARKAGKLGPNEHFANSSKIMLNVYKNAVEPAVQKAISMMTVLAALPGNPVMYFGDELAATGGEEKTKNIYTKDRNARKMLELKEGLTAEFKQKVKALMDGAMGIRSTLGAEALNNGTPYMLETHGDGSALAYMMHDGKGNSVISIFNAKSGIQHASRYDYSASTEARNEARTSGGSINADNRFVPVHNTAKVDYIKLGNRISLPVGTRFYNTNPMDKSEYVVDVKDGEYVIKRVLGSREDKIVMNGSTSRNGVMVLTTVALGAAAAIAGLAKGGARTVGRTLSRMI